MTNECTKKHRHRYANEKDNTIAVKFSKTPHTPIDYHWTKARKQKYIQRQPILFTVISSLCQLVAIRKKRSVFAELQIVRQGLLAGIVFHEETFNCILAIANSQAHFIGPPLRLVTEWNYKHQIQEVRHS